MPANGTDERQLERAFAIYAASAPARNLTLEAIANAGLPKAESKPVLAQVPFSSRRRWSALDLGDEGLVLGAPERFAHADHALAQRANKEASDGRRVLTLATTDTPLSATSSES